MEGRWPWMVCCRGGGPAAGPGCGGGCGPGSVSGAAGRAQEPAGPGSELCCLTALWGGRAPGQPPGYCPADHSRRQVRQQFLINQLLTFQLRSSALLFDCSSHNPCWHTQTLNCETRPCPWTVGSTELPQNCTPTCSVYCLSLELWLCSCTVDDQSHKRISKMNDVLYMNNSATALTANVQTGNLERLFTLQR